MDRYSYRSDGNFVVRCKCAICGTRFDMSALANAYGGTKCSICKEVETTISRMEQAETRLAEADRILDRRIVISRRAIDRDNLRALKFCKNCLYLVVTCILLYGIAWIVLTQ